MLRRFAFALAAVLFVLPLGAARGQAVDFTVPPVDQALDLHGDPVRAQLVVFMAGNQYMVMPALLSAFRKRYPRVRGIFYETLPPGIVPCGRFEPAPCASAIS